MRILIACERSQRVLSEFLRFGHEVYSCDIEPSTGPYPLLHIQTDVRRILGRSWDMVIAFPPCTDLAISGRRYFPEKRADGRQIESIRLFMDFVDCAPRWAIENPIGIMAGVYIRREFPDLAQEIAGKGFPRKPDQIVQPYFFGDRAKKSTCLWLGNLPRLVHSPAPTLFGDPVHTDKGEFFIWNGRRHPAWMHRGNGRDRRAARSVTFPGIARAMAENWGNTGNLQ